MLVLEGDADASVDDFEAECCGERELVLFGCVCVGAVGCFFVWPFDFDEVCVECDCCLGIGESRGVFDVVSEYEGDEVWVCEGVVCVFVGVDLDGEVLGCADVGEGCGESFED